MNRENMYSTNQIKAQQLTIPTSQETRKKRISRAGLVEIEYGNESYGM